VAVTSSSAAWRREGARQGGDDFIGGEGVATASLVRGRCQRAHRLYHSSAGRRDLRWESGPEGAVNGG
jgi:hypothetical protein